MTKKPVKVRILRNRVIKWFPPELKHRAAAEVRAYQNVSFAAPELLD